MIKVVNLKNYKPCANELLIKVDRTTPVGNPFVMHKECERDKVCEQYEEYFKSKMLNSKDKQDEFVNYMRKVYLAAKKAQRNNFTVCLGCWCYPKRCHATTIKEYLEQFLK